MRQTKKQDGAMGKRGAADKSVGQLSIRDMVQTLTNGRPFVFVIMGYNSRYELFEKIKRVIEAEFNIACIRADDVKSSGHDLRDKIHYLITRAEVVLGEISEPTSNVYYEIGYAVGIQTPPMLLFDGDGKVPTDLEGLELIRYHQTRDGAQALESNLREHVRARLNLAPSLFRDMLQGPDPQPAYIVASPKYPGKHSRIAGQVYDGRTFGDHLGILGLLSAFGSMWDEGKRIELISAQHSPPNLLEHDYNLYLIGSEKTNQHTASVLERIQKNGSVRWHFDPIPPFTREDTDWPCSLFCSKRAEKKRSVQVEPVIGKKQTMGPKQEEIWIEDYGIIIRAPHPNHANRIVLILAGAHSLGTGAACLAATRSELLRKVRNALPPGTLEDKSAAFWVLVKGAASAEKDMLLDPEGVTVESAGVY